MQLFICGGGNGPPLLSFLAGLSPKLRRKICRELLLLSGTPLPLLREPHVKHFGLERYQQFYELRAKGDVMVRMLFTPLSEDRILLLHPFVKKRPRDTMQALERALTLLKETKAKRREILELPAKILEGFEP